MSDSGENKPGDEALHDASRAAIERMQADPKVKELLGKLDAMVASGKDESFDELQPVSAPAPAASAEAAPSGAHAEHFESVRLGPSHQVAHEDKIIVQPKRSLRQLAEEAGVKLDDFKKLAAGNQTARTQVAVRILDHLDAAYAQLPRTVGGGTAMLGQPDSVRGAVAAGAQVTDAGAIDPAVRTVGGGTLKGMPVPVAGGGVEAPPSSVASSVPSSAAPSSGVPSSGAPVSGPLAEPAQALGRPKAGPSQWMAVLVILVLAAAAAVITAAVLMPGESAPATATATATAQRPPAAEPEVTAEPVETAAPAETAAPTAASSSAAPTPTPPATPPKPPTTAKPPPKAPPPPTTTGHKPMFERK